MEPVIQHTPAEAERRSRVAYSMWTDACSRTGLNVPAWQELLADEKYQWTLVYDGVARESRSSGGQMEDDPDRLRRAADYIERSRA